MAKTLNPRAREYGIYKPVFKSGCDGFYADAFRAFARQGESLKNVRFFRKEEATGEMTEVSLRQLMSEVAATAAAGESLEYTLAGIYARGQKGHWAWADTNSFGHAWVFIPFLPL